MSFVPINMKTKSITIIDLGEMFDERHKDWTNSIIFMKVGNLVVVFTACPINIAYTDSV
jgi:hypothetical protein